MSPVWVPLRFVDGLISSSGAVQSWSAIRNIFFTLIGYVFTYSSYDNIAIITQGHNEIKIMKGGTQGELLHLNNSRL